MDLAWEMPNPSFQYYVEALGGTEVALGIIGFANFLGMALVIQSIRMLYKMGRGVPLGEVYPYSQSSILLTSGIYAYTRNPMLLGYLLSLCGFGLTFQSIGIAFLLPIFYMSIWMIWIKKFEEPALKQRFGEAYQQYKARTPFILPRLKNPFR